MCAAPVLPLHTFETLKAKQRRTGAARKLFPRTLACGSTGV